MVLRLPEKTLTELFLEKGVKKLKYFPNGHVKKEYAVISKRILEDPARLKKLIDHSIKYTSQLP